LLPETLSGQVRLAEDTNMAGVMNGKVAVVTGGGRGVGLGIAREFLAEGATVVVTDIAQELLDNASAELGPQCLALWADVTKLADMERVYAEVSERFGRLDAVVANAGVGDSAKLGAITEKQFDYIFDVNVKGVLFTVQAALPHMQAGTVVVIGSTASIQAVDAMSIYGGSKAALRAMVRCWIKDIAHSDIRINMLSLGAVDTPSLRNALEGASGAGQVDRLVKQMGEGNPLGRLARASEIGKAAVFLSSDASSFVTGADVFADGGMAQTG
jgi:NAD(P)-dependent dehydrogenase (short-subunit alcohol dehydrogenase family)